MQLCFGSISHLLLFNSYYAYAINLGQPNLTYSNLT